MPPKWNKPQAVEFPYSTGVKIDWSADGDTGAQPAVAIQCPGPPAHGVGPDAVATSSAAIAGLSRPRYIREAALAVQIYRTTLPSDLLAYTSRAIASVRALARSLIVSQHPNTLRHLEAAMVELYDKDAELERHTEKIVAALALLPPTPLDPAITAPRLPGPGSVIWRARH